MKFGVLHFSRGVVRAAAETPNSISMAVATEEKKLTLLEHLLELRNRITYIAIALVITIAGSFIFANKLFEILKAPAGNIQFVYIDVTEMIGVYMQVCVVSGLILAAPFIIYQLVMFVSPGLSDKEKKFVNIVVPWVGLMFIMVFAVQLGWLPIMFSYPRLYSFF